MPEGLDSFHNESISTELLDQPQQLNALKEQIFADLKEEFTDKETQKELGAMLTVVVQEIETSANSLEKQLLTVESNETMQSVDARLDSLELTVDRMHKDILDGMMMKAQATQDPSLEEKLASFVAEQRREKIQVSWEKRISSGPQPQESALAYAGLKISQRLLSNEKAA